VVLNESDPYDGLALHHLDARPPPAIREHRRGTTPVARSKDDGRRHAPLAIQQDLDLRRARAEVAPPQLLLRVPGYDDEPGVVLGVLNREPMDVPGASAGDRQTEGPSIHAEAPSLHQSEHGSVLHRLTVQR